MHSRTEQNTLKSLTQVFSHCTSISQFYWLRKDFPLRCDKCLMTWYRLNAKLKLIALSTIDYVLDCNVAESGGELSGRLSHDFMCSGTDWEQHRPLMWHRATKARIMRESSHGSLLQCADYSFHIPLVWHVVLKLLVNVHAYMLRPQDCRLPSLVARGCLLMWSVCFSVPS